MKTHMCRLAAPRRPYCAREEHSAPLRKMYEEHSLKKYQPAVINPCGLAAKAYRDIIGNNKLSAVVEWAGLGSNFGKENSPSSLSANWKPQ